MAFSILKNKLTARGYWSAAPGSEGGAGSGGGAAEPAAGSSPADAGATLLGGGQPGAADPAPQPTDQAPVDGATADGDAGKTADTTDTTEPLTEYADFSFPDGFEADPVMMDAFKAMALEAKLSQEQAQHFASMGAQLQQKMLSEHFSAIEQQKADWEAEARADKEYGGAKFDENLTYAARARDAFVTPALREQLDKTGLGNHPDLIRVFVRAGKLISEDSLVSGGQRPSSQTKSAASTLYPNQQ
ncbi:hypothetical protein QZJ86_12100 [Methylomonas montana]|uniref:hypothetical protein n=1 Tax=Methylomonas montana TaxID=3058963 RepID=UPI00265952D3|nr:hypothetical protein [Methylomonas montana]WKJ88764.1 hypothetical protein QZJ86_12100 [Methylomonas montana]